MRQNRRRADSKVLSLRKISEDSFRLIKVIGGPTPDWLKDMASRESESDEAIEDQAPSS